MTAKCKEASKPEIWGAETFFFSPHRTGALQNWRRPWQAGSSTCPPDEMNLQGDPKANSPHLVGLSLGVNERKDGDIAGEGELVAWGPEVAFPQVSALFVLVPKAPWNWAADKCTCIYRPYPLGETKESKTGAEGRRQNSWTFGNSVRNISLWKLWPWSPPPKKGP